MFCEQSALCSQQPAACCAIVAEDAGRTGTMGIKGYLVSSATIRFVVAWKPKDAPKDEKEHAVLLLDLELKKTTNTQNNCYAVYT